MMSGVVQNEVVDKIEQFYVPTMARGQMVRVGTELSITDLGPTYVVPQFFWLAKAVWEDLRDFQTTPPPPPNFPMNHSDIMRDTLRGDHVHWAAEMDRKVRLNPHRTHLWRVHVISHDWKEDVEMVIALGVPTLTEWTWFEAKIAQPILSRICRVANFLRRNLRKSV